MILTVTLNPSVDMSYQLDTLNIDGVNRVGNVLKTAGGKGLNVARVLSRLDEHVGASGYLGGHLGDFIAEEITDAGIDDHFVRISGETRNCIAMLHDDGKQTEVLESGPAITEWEARDYLEQFPVFMNEADIVTLSGSLPKGLTDGFYSALIETANDAGKRVLLDTKGDLLKKTLTAQHKPFLIKPNQEELKDLTGVDPADDATVAETLKGSIFSDVPWVVVTQGAEGAVVKHGETLYKATIPKVEAKNPVGSGDSVIAGFAAGLSRGFDDIDCIKFGLAMGVLNAMEEKTGDIDPEKIDWCVKEIQVNEL